jgi:hypothetical protein
VALERKPRSLHCVPQKTRHSGRDDRIRKENPRPGHPPTAGLGQPPEGRETPDKRDSSHERRAMQNRPSLRRLRSE